MSNYKYIYIHMVERKAKTDVYAVYSKNQSSLLGTIKWFTRWRQYVMFPRKNTVWSTGCLADIADFIQCEMDKRKRTPELHKEAK